MNDFESLELRVSKLEEEAKELIGNVNAITLEQVRSVTKLDIVLATLSELKEGLESLKNRPGQFWDKLIVAVISAVCGALVSFIF